MKQEKPSKEQIADQMTKVAIYLAIIGVIMVLIIALTPIKYPMLAFRILAILGISAIFVSLLLYFCVLGIELFEAYQKKQWGVLAFKVIVALLFIWLLFFKR